MLELMLESRCGEFHNLKSRAGGTKSWKKVGQKIVEKTRIAIENHLCDHKNKVMLRLCWNLAAERIAEKKPGRDGKKIGKSIEFDGGEGVYS